MRIILSVLDIKLLFMTVKIFFQKEVSEGVDDKQKNALKDSTDERGKESRMPEVIWWSCLYTMERNTSVRLYKFRLHSGCIPGIVGKSMTDHGTVQPGS